MRNNSSEEGDVLLAILLSSYPPTSCFTHFITSFHQPKVCNDKNCSQLQFTACCIRATSLACNPREPPEDGPIECIRPALSLAQNTTHTQDWFPVHGFLCKEQEFTQTQNAFISVLVNSKWMCFHPQAADSSRPVLAEKCLPSCPMKAVCLVIHRMVKLQDLT